MNKSLLIVSIVYCLGVIVTQQGQGGQGGEHLTARTITILGDDQEPRIVLDGRGQDGGRIVLHGDEGEGYIELAMPKGDPRIELYAASGQRVASMGLRTGRCVLTLLDRAPEGVESAELELRPDGVVQTWSGEIRYELTASAIDASLTMWGGADKWDDIMLRASSIGQPPRYYSAELRVGNGSRPHMTIQSKHDDPVARLSSAESYDKVRARFPE